MKIETEDKAQYWSQKAEYYKQIVRNELGYSRMKEAEIAWSKEALSAWANRQQEEREVVVIGGESMRKR